jgi:hypothetical protein
MSNGFLRQGETVHKINMLMAPGLEPAVGIADNPQVPPPTHPPHPPTYCPAREIKRSAIYISMAVRKPSAARCFTEQKKNTFSLEKAKRNITLKVFLKCLNAGNVTGSDDGEKS